MGSNGRVFNAMMRTANLDREDFLITHVFNEAPPDGELGSWLVPTRLAKERGLTDIPSLRGGYLQPEFRWHLLRLQEELEDARPNLIVPLGDVALWALTGNSDIGSQRGGLLPASRLLPGAKLLPTFHPSFILKQWKFYSVVVGDFIKADAESRRGPKLILPEKRLLIEPTLQEIEAYVPNLLASDLLSVDIETGWGQITNIGFAPNSTEAICIPFVDTRKPNRSYWSSTAEEISAWGLVKTILEGPTPKLGQNFGGYDAFWLIARMGFAPRNFLHDTRLMHHALYPELPKDLEFMGASYTQQGAWKYWARKKHEKRDD